MVESIDNASYFSTYSQISVPSVEKNPVPAVKETKDLTKSTKKEDQKLQSPPEEETDSAVSQDEIDAAIVALEDLNRHFETHLNFSKDESTGDTIVKIINSETDEVVRQIPSEEILRIASKMQDVIGVLFDKEY